MTPEDPYVWLEEVEGDKALDWVKQRNAESAKQLEGDLAFRALRDDLLAILDSDDKIPFVAKEGEFYYNFWKARKTRAASGAAPRWTNTASRSPSGKCCSTSTRSARRRKRTGSGKATTACVRSKRARPTTAVSIVLSRGGADADGLRASLIW